MKALSIRQPWAWLIVHGYKPVESRTWRTGYRGLLLIHAAQAFDHEGYLWVRSHTDVGEAMPFINEFKTSGQHRGGIVGQATLYDCTAHPDIPLPGWDGIRGRHGRLSDPRTWFFGPYGLWLRDAAPMPFKPFRGQLGLFNVPEEFIA
jgi:hypothetical protein